MAARKAVHAASVGRNMVELFGVPTIGSVLLRKPELVCRSVTLATPATNSSAVHAAFAAPTTACDHCTAE